MNTLKIFCLSFFLLCGVRIRPSLHIHVHTRIATSSSFSYTTTTSSHFSSLSTSPHHFLTHSPHHTIPLLIHPSLTPLSLSLHVTHPSHSIPLYLPTSHHPSSHSPITSTHTHPVPPLSGVCVPSHAVVCVLLVCGSAKYLPRNTHDRTRCAHEFRALAALTAGRGGG